MKNFFNFILHPFAFILGQRGSQSVALGNELGGMFDNGRETLLIDPATTLPVSGKNLIYKRGSSQYYATIADGASLPLGVSPDAPYQLGDFLAVERLGAARGTPLGISAGAVTIDNMVYSAANGLVGDVTTAGHGTFWIIGRALKTVGAANAEIPFIPCFPYQATQ